MSRTSRRNAISRDCPDVSFITDVLAQGLYVILKRQSRSPRHPRGSVLRCGDFTLISHLHRRTCDPPLIPGSYCAMSQTPASASSSGSNFRAIFIAALKAYEKKTKTDLHTHPLAIQLQSCQSSSDILAVLHDKVNEFDQSRGQHERLSRWLNPTINVLYAFSATLGQGVGLVSLDSCSYYPLLIAFADILSRTSDLCRCWGPLIGEHLPRSLRGLSTDVRQAAKDVDASQEALADLFESIENFFKRLESYTEVPPTDTMTDIIVKIMIEVLNIFAIATKEMKQGRASELLPRNT